MTTQVQAVPFHRKPVTIAIAVVALHVGGLAALQSGLLVRAYELIVPVEAITQAVPVAAPEPIPAPPVPPPPAPAPAPRKETEPTPAPAPAPQPLAIKDTTPAPNAPVATPTPPAPLPPITAPIAAAPSPAPAPAPRVELPRSDADYLNNPKPPYPSVSKRMGEQGRVMVRVYVGENGQPQKAELRTSSGFDRLDATAVATVMRWRFIPGTRGGQPEAMWVTVPMDFVLDN